MKKLIIIAVILISISSFAEEKERDSDFEIGFYQLEEYLSEKINIGTRGTEHTTFNSLVPIDVISAKDIEKWGLTELGMIIH